MHFFRAFLTISIILRVTVSAPAGHSIATNSGAPSGPGPYRRPPNRSGRPSPGETLAGPIKIPKIILQRGGVPPYDHEDTKARVINDFRVFAVDYPELAKITKLAHVVNDWVYFHAEQYLQVRYYQGIRPESAPVPEGVRTIYRKIPPAKSLALAFGQKIPIAENNEITPQIARYYDALPDNSPSKRGHVTWVAQGWRPGGGNTDEIRDHATFTFHKSFTHTDQNIIGGPHVVRRPLTVSFGNEVNPRTRKHIEAKVREQHAIMGGTSNVALVVGGSYKNKEGKDEVQAGYYEFPDCPKSQDERCVHHGMLPLPLE